MPEDVVLDELTTRLGSVTLTQSHEPPHVHTVRSSYNHYCAKSRGYDDAYRMFVHQSLLSIHAGPEQLRRHWKVELEEKSADAEKPVDVLDRALQLIKAEHDRAFVQHGRFNSYHEAWAVMRKEGFEMKQCLALIQAFLDDILQASATPEGGTPCATS